MFWDYASATSKMKSNYSKLYDITAMPSNVLSYAIPLTQSLYKDMSSEFKDTVCLWRRNCENWFEHSSVVEHWVGSWNTGCSNKNICLIFDRHMYKWTRREISCSLHQKGPEEKQKHTSSEDQKLPQTPKTSSDPDWEEPGSHKNGRKKQQLIEWMCISGNIQLRHTNVTIIKHSCTKRTLCFIDGKTELSLKWPCTSVKFYFGQSIIAQVVSKTPATQWGKDEKIIHSSGRLSWEHIKWNWHIWEQPVLIWERYS